MKDNRTFRSSLLFSTLALGTTAGVMTTLGRYVQKEIRRRGYPSWQECRCDFKSQPTIFQVWYSQHGQRGETIVAQEWGSLLLNPPQWFRRFLHHSSQVIATLNPQGRYVERITLTPQAAHQLALFLRSLDQHEDTPLTDAHIVWRREVLRIPRHIFDVWIRRLYPSHVSAERSAELQSLPALWDPYNDLPLPSEGTLLETPPGTRIDYIGWTPSQISYCTVRLRGNTMQASSRAS